MMTLKLIPAAAVLALILAVPAAAQVDKSMPGMAGPVSSGPLAGDGAQAPRIYAVQYQRGYDQQERDRQAQEQNRRDQNNADQGASGDHRDNDGQRGTYDERRDGRYNNRQQDRQYYNQNDDANFRAEEHYRRDRKYGIHNLNENDPVYRGRDNRYYCRRSDGTTGLIIGGLGGGVLGNLIAPGGSKTLGTLLGGGLGAVAGNAVGRSRVRCR